MKTSKKVKRERSVSKSSENSEMEAKNNLKPLDAPEKIKEKVVE